MKKICRTCKREKESEEFSFSKQAKDKLQRECKLCQKETAHEHYERNKEQYKERAKINIQKNRDYVNEIKRSLGCAECSLKEPAALDFHHKDPTIKEYGISNLVIINNRKKLDEEIKKCIVLCSNCHRILHQK